MVRLLTRPWSWLVDGATEATAWVLDRLRAQPVVRVALEQEGASVRAADGTVIARLVEEGGALRLDPPAAAQRLAGAAVDVICPSDWLFRRTLDPVAAQSAAFLDGFVRHQIDRLTPWRVEDVDYCILQAPLPGDPGRLAIEIGVLPKRLTGAALGVLRTCDPGRLVLSVSASQNGRRFVMPIDDRTAIRLSRIKPAVTVALVLYLLAWPAALGWLWWTTAAVADEIAAADEVIEARKNVLAAAALHDHAAEHGGAVLLHLRRQRPRAVDLIEALSAALPDSAYLTDVTINGPDIRVSGVSTDTSQLVPALETSGRFADAAFFDTTTRVEDGNGDRFHIAMQARPQASKPPPP